MLVKNTNKNFYNKGLTNSLRCGKMGANEVLAVNHYERYRFVAVLQLSHKVI